MSTYEIRRKNLREVLQERGGPSAVARTLGYANPAFLVQMTGPNYSRSVSEKSARAIEKALGLPELYLDQEHDSQVIRVSTELVHKVASAVATAIKEAKCELSPAKFADVVAMAYEDAVKVGAPQREQINKLVRLAAK